MLPLQERSQLQEPSAQILDRIPMDEIAQNPKQKQQQFQLEPQVQKPLQQITGDFGDSTSLHVLVVIFTVLILFGGLLGFQTVLYGYQYIENGNTDIVSCTNPISFNLDGEIRCTNFDLDLSPRIGIVVKANAFNQYLQARLLITRPSQRYQTANIKGRLSVYSLKQNDDKQNPYLKKDIVVQNQRINFEVHTQSLSSPKYSQSEVGFVAPIKLVRPIDEKAYLIVIRLDAMEMRYLETSTNVQLTVEYIPQETSYFILIVRIVCIVLVAISCIVFKCMINSDQPPQQGLSDNTKHQQRIVFYFGILQGLCLDPLSAITFVKPNIFSDILSSLFLTFQLASVVLLACYFLDYYMKKQFQTRKQIACSATAILLMAGVYSFASTFLEWRAILPLSDQIIYFVITIIGLTPLLYPVYHGFSMLFRHRQFETRHLGFYFFTSGVLLVLAANIARFYYRVYSIQMSPISVPITIAAYVFCIQFFFKAQIYEADQTEVEVVRPDGQQQLPLYAPNHAGENVSDNNNQQKLQKEDLDYFEIQERTQQFENRSDNTGF